MKNLILICIGVLLFQSHALASNMGYTQKMNTETLQGTVDANTIQINSSSLTNNTIVIPSEINTTTTNVQIVQSPIIQSPIIAKGGGGNVYLTLAKKPLKTYKITQNQTSQTPTISPYKKAKNSAPSSVVSDQQTIPAVPSKINDKKKKPTKKIIIAESIKKEETIFPQEESKPTKTPDTSFSQNKNIPSSSLHESANEFNQKNNENNFEEKNTQIQTKTDQTPTKNLLRLQQLGLHFSEKKQRLRKKK